MSSTAPSSKLSTPNLTARSAKSKLSKIAVLKLSSALLSQFPHEKKEGRKASTAKAPAAVEPVVAAQNSPPAEAQADRTVGTSVASSSTLQVPDATKKKGPGTLKAGTKRPAAAMADGTNGLPGATKPRAKAAPKKRPRIDGTVGDEPSRPWTTPAPLAGHKLGPKANQGAINAGLRALDRTGKPCRKWEKKGFSVKSFTGVVWHLPSWGAPPRAVASTVSEGEQSTTPNSNSENVPRNSSSAVGSDASRNAVVEPVPASSPVTTSA